MISRSTDETLSFPPYEASLLAPYLPPVTPRSLSGGGGTSTSNSSSGGGTTSSIGIGSEGEGGGERRMRVHVTLTYAHSLDASLSAAPGVRTALSGPRSKAMTHFLRSRHAAVLVGAGTAVADDPGLNSRLEGLPEGQLEGQPRPVVLDPRGRWAVHEGSKVIDLARRRRGLAPFVLVAEGTPLDEGRRTLLEAVGGKVITLEARGPMGRFEWEDVLAVLEREGLGSVMIEGGGEVINSLLVPPTNRLVDSVIVTIAPTWLGQGGVVVSPPKTVREDGTPAPPLRLTDVRWCPLGDDVVLCGRIPR